MTNRGKTGIDVLGKLGLRCRHVRQMLEQEGITVIHADLDAIDGALLGDVLVVNANNGPCHRALTKLHGLHHSLRAERPVVVPL